MAANSGIQDDWRFFPQYPGNIIAGDETVLVRDGVAYRVSREQIRQGIGLGEKGIDARVSEDGIMLWDAENGYPIVSKDGAWQPIILGDSPMDFGITLAEAEILGNFGDTVSVLQKKKTLLKFGANPSLGVTLDTVWTQGGNEVYVDDNLIDTVSSTDAGDTQVLTIEGHTVTGTGTSAQFAFSTQQVTLAGQAKVTLATPLARVSRVFITNGGGALAGDVYVYQDTTISAGAPTTSDPIHMKLLVGETQSFKAATTFSNTDYFISTGGFVSLNKKTAATVDFEFQVRLVGGVFRPVSRLSLASTGQNTQQISFYPYVVVPKNADIRVVAVASTTNVGVSASFSGFLAGVV